MSNSISTSATYLYHYDSNGGVISGKNSKASVYEKGSFSEAIADKNKERNIDSFDVSDAVYCGELPIDAKDIIEVFNNPLPKNLYEYDGSLDPGIDLSKLVRFYSTGDPNQDRLINMGLDYQEKCMDFTHASDFYELNREQYEKGFDGMSKEEIYIAIYEKYQHCYGENFLDADAIGYPRASSDLDGCNGILRDFKKELKAVFGSNPDDIAKIRKKALYGDMDDIDILTDIIEKYKENGKITYEGMYKIMNEADHCYLGGGISRALDQSEWMLYNKSVFDTESYHYKRERLLDKPLTRDFLKEAERMSTDYAKKGIEFYIMEDVYTVFGMIASEL